MLGEASTTEIAKNKNAQGFIENKQAANSTLLQSARTKRLYARRVEQHHEGCHSDKSVNSSYEILQGYILSRLLNIWANSATYEYKA